MIMTRCFSLALSWTVVWTSLRSYENKEHTWSCWPSQLSTIHGATTWHEGRSSVKHGFRLNGVWRYIWPHRHFFFFYCCCRFGRQWRQMKLGSILTFLPINKSPNHDHPTLGRVIMKSTRWALGHFLLCPPIHSHRSFIRLLCTARIAYALLCAHSFARLLTPSLWRAWERELWIGCVDFIQFQPTVQPSSFSCSSWRRSCLAQCLFVLAILLSVQLQ